MPRQLPRQPTPRSPLQTRRQSTPRSRLRSPRVGRRLWSLAAAFLLVLAVVPATGGTASAKPPASDAKVISDWNQIAVNTMVGDTTKTGHPQVFLYLGFVQAAVYDAVVGIDRGYVPYAFHDRAPHPSSSQAAAVAAAHRVLVTYFSYAQTTLDAAYAASLARIPDGKAKTNGIGYGIRAADNLIRLRAHDGRDEPILFTQPAAPGVWRPTPPGLLSMFDPWLGFVTPLLVHSATQFAPPPPPTLTSDRYTRDFTEVKDYGSATSTARNADQTATALFFSGNALVQFNATLRDQATVRGLDIAQSARMFAAADMSTADALITVWHAKYVYGSLAADHGGQPGRHRRQPRHHPGPILGAAGHHPGVPGVPQRLQLGHRGHHRRPRAAVPHPAAEPDAHLHRGPRRHPALQHRQRSTSGRR